MNIGDIYVVNFEPSVGSEIRKIRPAVILQNKIACMHSPLITIVPLSSKQY
jgi:mRNA interferase MazF